MIDPLKAQQLTRLVQKAQRILVVSHKNCGDATGSVTACRLVLERLGKKVTMFLPAPVPAAFRFLSCTEEVVSNPALIHWEDYDLLLCVDAAEPAMTGLADSWSEIPDNVSIVNFDHHLTNPDYGQLNIVDRSAPATCVMLYEWFVSAGFIIDSKVATCLLTGLLTDTGSFSNPATNEVALATASQLLLKGAGVAAVLSKVARNRTLPELKLWGRAFERLKEYPELGLVTTIITQADIAEAGVSAEALEGVANFLNELSGYRAILVLKEQSDGTIKGSLRTTRDDVDVAAVAGLFGGGGHKKSAGFTVVGKLVETEQGWRIQSA